MNCFLSYDFKLMGLGFNACHFAQIPLQSIGLLQWILSDSICDKMWHDVESGWIQLSMAEHVGECKVLWVWDGLHLKPNSWLKPDQLDYGWPTTLYSPPIANRPWLQTCTFWLTVDLYISSTYFIMPFPFITFILIPLLFIYSIISILRLIYCLTLAGIPILFS